MIGFTIALVVIIVIVGVVGFYAPSIDDGSLVGIFAGLVIILAGLFLFLQVNQIISSKNKMQFYNKTFNTNYTHEEVYWNDSTIKEQLIGEKKNVNLKIEKEK